MKIDKPRKYQALLYSLEVDLGKYFNQGYDY